MRSEKSNFMTSSIARHLYASKSSVLGCHTFSTKATNSCVPPSPPVCSLDTKPLLGTKRFLYRIVTGDEKWYLYANMKQKNGCPAKQATPRTKPELRLAGLGRLNPLRNARKRLALRSANVASQGGNPTEATQP